MTTSRRMWTRVGAGCATLALLGLAGCSSASAPSSADATLSPLSTSPAGSQTAAAAASVRSSAGGSQSGASAANDSVVPVTEPDIILTGTMTMLVGRNGLARAFQRASQDATDDGGYVESTASQFAGTSDPYADVTIRVPAANFDALVGEIGDLGKVQQRGLRGQDVTGQVVNLGARIANLDSEQVALRQLIVRAGSIPDILEVENHLFSVEQQVEEMTAQRDDLVGQVAYATLTVDLDVPAAPAPRPKPTPRPPNAAARAAQIALHNTAAALHDIVLAIGEAFPVLLVAALVGALFVIRRRRSSSSPAPRPAD